MARRHTDIIGYLVFTTRISYYKTYYYLNIDHTEYVCHHQILLLYDIYNNNQQFIAELYMLARFSKK